MCIFERTGSQGWRLGILLPSRGRGESLVRGDMVVGKEWAWGLIIQIMSVTTRLQELLA